jgi:hypothetical protein
VNGEVVVLEEVDFGQYVTTDDYKGIAFWVDNWAKDVKQEYVEYIETDDSGEVFFGWEEVEVISDSVVECYMIGDDRMFRFEISELTLIDVNDFCGSCGQIGCGHG